METLSKKVRERDEVPLGNPVVFSRLLSPLLSCPPPPPFSPSPPISNANFVQRDPRHLARLSFVSSVSGGLPVSSHAASLHLLQFQHTCNFLMSTPLPPLSAPSINSLFSVSTSSLLLHRQDAVVPR